MDPPLIYTVSESGPTENSNWLLRAANGGGLLQGGYPNPGFCNNGVPLPDLLLASGVNDFVSLVTSQDAATHSLPEYQSRLSAGRQLVSGVRSQGAVYHSLEITDRGITEDETLVQLVDYILHQIQQGKILYVHCFGGHGRSGTVCVALLLRLGYDLKTAVNYVNASHQKRKHRPGVTIQGRGPQRNQVKRLETVYRQKGYIKS